MSNNRQAINELVDRIVMLDEEKRHGMWGNRKLSFAEGLAVALMFLHENHGFPLDRKTIRDHLGLGRVEDLVWNGPDKYPGLGGYEDGPIASLYKYLTGLPGYDTQKRHTGQQKEVTQEAHGYITMQLTRNIDKWNDDAVTEREGMGNE